MARRFRKGGKATGEAPAPWGVEVMDLNNDTDLNKVDDSKEVEGDNPELDLETKIEIESMLGNNALKMMTVDVSGEYEKMRRFNTMERFEAERQMDIKLRKDAKGLGKVGRAIKNVAKYGLFKNIVLANIAADQSATMKEYNSIYASEDRKGNVNVDKKTRQALGDEYLVKQFTDRFDEVLDEKGDVKGDGEIEKSEDAEREAEIKDELKKLAEAAARGDEKQLKDAKKVYKEAVKRWRSEGLDDGKTEEKKGIFGRVKSFFKKTTPKMSADNFIDVGRNIIDVSKKLKSHDDGLDAIKKYVDENVSLYKAEGKSAINTEYRDRWNTEMALNFGMGGAILATAVGPIKTALKNLPGVSKVAISTALGAGFGGLRGKFGKDATFSKRDMAQALGRAEVKKSKFAVAEKIAEKLTGAETGLYKSTWSINEILDGGEDESPMSLQKYMNRIETEDGGERWEMKDLSLDDKKNFATLLAGIRARLEVGDEMGVQLITHNLEVGGDAGKTQQDLYRLNSALGTARRGLRISTSYDTGGDIEQQRMNRQTIESIYLGAYIGTKDILKADIKMENDIREKVGKKIVMIDAVAGGAIAGLATSAGLLHRIMKNNPDMSAKEGIAAALGFKNTSKADLASEIASPSAEDTEAPDGVSGAEEVLDNGKQSFEVPEGINESMDDDNVVLAERTDAEGNTIYKVYSALIGKDDSSEDAATGYFSDTGVDVKLNKDGRTFDAESLQKLKNLYGNEYETVEVPVDEPSVEGGIGLSARELGDGVNIIDEPLEGGKVTTMSSYIRDDGNNWVINVWSTGRGKELGDGDMRYYFELGEGADKNVITCDIDENGAVVIPKDSMLGNMIKEDQNGDGVPEFLTKSHGVVEIADGKAITQASALGTGEYTPDNLKVAMSEAGLGAEAEPTVNTNTAYDYVFKDSEGKVTTIRAPRQVYSGAAVGEQEVELRYRDESFGRNIVLKDETINYGGDSTNDAMMLHKVEHVGGYNYSADALSISRDGTGEKMKDFYEGAALLKDEGMYDENNVFKAEDFEALPTEQKDEYAVKVMQELTKDASGNGVKAESWSSLFDIDGKGGRTMSEINEAGLALNVGSDSVYDAEVNKMMGDVYAKLEQFGMDGFKPQIKTLGVGTMNSSEYVKSISDGDAVRRLVASPNMITSEREAYVTLVDENGKSLADIPEIKESFRKALGVPKGAVIDEVGFKLKCRQPFASWHMPEGTTTPNVVTEEQIDWSDTTPEDVIPPVQQLPVQQPPVQQPPERERIIEREKITTTTTNTNTNTTTTIQEENTPEPTPEPQPQPEPTPTPEPEPQPEPTPTPEPEPTPEEPLTPKVSEESANMGNKNINYNPDVNSDNVLGPDQRDNTMIYDRDEGTYVSANDVDATDNPAASPEGGYDQSGADRVSTVLSEAEQQQIAGDEAAQAVADADFANQQEAAEEAIAQGQAEIAAEQEASNFMDSYQGTADWADEAGDDVSASDFADAGSVSESAGDITIDEGEVIE